MQAFLGLLVRCRALHTWCDGDQAFAGHAELLAVFRFSASGCHYAIGAAEKPHVEPVLQSACFVQACSRDHEPGIGFSRKREHAQSPRRPGVNDVGRES